MAKDARWHYTSASSCPGLEGAERDSVGVGNGIAGGGGDRVAFAALNRPNFRKLGLKRHGENRRFQLVKSVSFVGVRGSMKMLSFVGR